MVDCCLPRSSTTPGGIPYRWHTDDCQALYEVPVIIIEALAEIAVATDRVSNTAEHLDQSGSNR